MNHTEGNLSEEINQDDTLHDHKSEEKEALPVSPENEAIIGQPENISSKQTGDWKEKYEEVNDRFLRLYSEFDNYKKRTAKERIEFSKTAAADIFTAMLSVLDDFDRAAKAMEEAAEVNTIKEGMQLIHHKFRNTLISRGLEEMNAKGEVFNSDLHEAITSIPAPEENLKGKVIEEIEKGYSLNGKVIRFAKVVVGN